MAKAKNGGGVLDEQILRHAVEQSAFVLRPLPKDMDPAEADAAIGRLREQGLVHGPRREPNLTREGVEMARELAA